MHSTARHPRFLVPRRLIRYRHGEAAPGARAEDADPITRSPDSGVTPTRDADATGTSGIAGTGLDGGPIRLHDRTLDAGRS